MKIILASILLFFFFGLSTVNARAQIVINELMPNSSSGNTNDWVELYLLPSATQSAQLAGYSLQDSTSDIKDLSGSIQPGGFIVIDVLNRLNNAGDIIKLVNSGGTVDQISYGSEGGICMTDVDQTIGRFPDGTGSFVKFLLGTKGLANTGSQINCPTPSPTPTPTPTSTQSPSPSPTLNPSPIPSPTKRPSPTEAPSLVSFSSPQGTTGPEEKVLGIASSDFGTETSTPQVSESTDKKLPATALIFIFGGLGLMGVSLYLFFKAYNKKTEGLS